MENISDATDDWQSRPRDLRKSSSAAVLTVGLPDFTVGLLWQCVPCHSLSTSTPLFFLPLYCLLRSSSRLRSCVPPSSNCLSSGTLSLSLSLFLVSVSRPEIKEEAGLTPSGLCRRKVAMGSLRSLSPARVPQPWWKPEEEGGALQPSGPGRLTNWKWLCSPFCSPCWLTRSPGFLLVLPIPCFPN